MVYDGAALHARAALGILAATGNRRVLAWVSLACCHAWLELAATVEKQGSVIMRKEVLCSVDVDAAVAPSC